MSNTTDPEWTSQEDDLLFSLLHWSQSGIRSETRRPWKDIAVDMNAEALRLDMDTRFFHHENVHGRWWLKFGRFFPVGTSDEADPPSREPAAVAAAAPTTNLAALQDILARVGVESLNGQPLPPPARRGFQLPRRRFWLPDTVSETAEVASPSQTALPGEAAAVVAQTPGMEDLDCDVAQAENQVNGGGKDGVVEVETGSGSSDGLEALVVADAKGNRVARDPTRSWLF